jgi:hypothetical protein
VALQRRSQHDLFAEEAARVAYQKAHPRRHTLAPLENCSLYIECVSVCLSLYILICPSAGDDVDPALALLEDGRLTHYNPLPSLSREPSTIDLQPPSWKQLMADEMRKDFEKREYSDPFAKYASFSIVAMF